MFSNRRKFLTSGAAAGFAGLLAPASAAAFGRRRSSAPVCLPVPCPPVICCEPLNEYKFHEIKLGGPYPFNLAGKPGELHHVRFVYPIVPPMPGSAAVVSNSCILCAQGVYRSQPGGGTVGVGYLDVFVKLVGYGDGSFTLRVCMSDGTVKDVSIAFLVTP